jgi:hypothetical protein
MPYIPNAHTDSTPAAAVLGRRVYVAYKDHDSDHIHLASNSNLASSSSWQIVDVNTIPSSPMSPHDEPAQIRTDHGPAMTSTDDHLWLTFKGHNNPFIWRIALRELDVGVYELHRYGRLVHAQTARGPAMAGPTMDPISSPGMPRLPMVVYRGNRDDGVWVHHDMPEPDHDHRLDGTHSEFAPAAAYAELRSQEARFVAYTDRTSRQVMFIHNYRPGRPDMPSGWSRPVPVPYAYTSRQPALAVHDDVLYLALKSRDADDYQVWVSSWEDNLWVSHGSMSRMYTNQGPALVSYQNRLYVVFKGHNNDRVWYAEAPVSRRNVRTTIVVSLGGVFSTDINDVVQQRAEAHGYPLTLGANWSQDRGDMLAGRGDAARIRDRINALVSRNGGDKRLLSLLVVGKSAGGVLAWNTFKRHFVSQIADFHRVALVMVDPHGSAWDDGRSGPYNQGQDLWWPGNWPSDTEAFRVYNIYQYRGTPTGASFPDRRVYENVHLSGSSIDHWSITSHSTTCGLITEALSFALSGG